MISNIEFRGKSYNLFPDVNIVIGKNGIGKTSFLEHIANTHKSLVYMFMREELIEEGRKRNSASHNLLVMLEAISLHSDCDVILIDDIELFLDIDTQRTLISSIKELAPNSQLICTTNSPTIYYQGWINKVVRLSE